MTEKTKGLLESGTRNAFGEGAARFDRLIESVKTQHAVRVQSESAPVSNPLTAVSPEEEWSKQFQSLGIGPERHAITPSEMAFVPRGAILAGVPPVRDIAPSRATEIVGRPSPSGADMGKPVKAKRSWLGRVFGRA